MFYPIGQRAPLDQRLYLGEIFFVSRRFVAMFVFMTVLVSVVVVVLDELRFILLRAVSALEPEDGGEFVRFGQQFGRLEIIVAPFESERLPVLVGSNRFQRELTRGGRSGPFALRIGQLTPETE